MDDPIFAALDEYTESRQSAIILHVELTNPESTGRAGEDREIKESLSTERNALDRLVHTKPTTLAGAAALLRYISNSLQDPRAEQWKVALAGCADALDSMKA